MTIIKNFQLLADFNAWANIRLFSSCRKLDENEYKKDRKAFFTSIHGTLNHLLVVDNLYISRIEGKDHNIKSMDQIFHDNIDELEDARMKKDKHLVNLVNKLSEDNIGTEITYKSFDSTVHTFTINFILMTLFNHQTHHRGQVHNMLSQAGIKPPQLDIPDFKG